MNTLRDQIFNLMTLLYNAHPWHGIEIGEDSPKVVNSYIEMVPTDTVKYELDKASGLLKVDRPQKFSSMPPMLYGLIPRTYCGSRIAEFSNQKTKRTDIIGDSDPLDICVLTERPITQSNIIVPAVVIGGFRMIDNNEADDKIIAYLKNDLVYSEWQDISDIPDKLIERLKHYFLTYKDIPGQEKHVCEITHIYNREEAYEVITRSCEDYNVKYSGLDNIISQE
jgi:inorganic pyrophosphatase